MNKYILNALGEPQEVKDAVTWAQWFQTADRRLALTEVSPTTRVSTVFLGIDHQWGNGPPLLWETMVFRDDRGEECVRTSTRQGAMIAHNEMVTRIRRGSEQS